MDTQNSISTNTPKKNLRQGGGVLFGKLPKSIGISFQGDIFHKNIFYGEVDCSFSKHLEAFLLGHESFSFQGPKMRKQRKTPQKKLCFPQIVLRNT